VESEEFLPELNSWFEVHAYPSTGGMVLYLKEVTKQRELVEQLRQAQKMEAVGRLAGGVAHDFNNLLTIILGYTQMIAERIEPDDPTQALLRKSCKRAGARRPVTGQLLAFSRKKVLHPAVLDVMRWSRGWKGCCGN